VLPAGDPAALIRPSRDLIRRNFPAAELNVATSFYVPICIAPANPVDANV
jgi:hypothetical protein